MKGPSYFVRACAHARWRCLSGGDWRDLSPTERRYRLGVVATDSPEPADSGPCWIRGSVRTDSAERADYMRRRPGLQAGKAVRLECAPVRSPPPGCPPVAGCFKCCFSLTFSDEDCRLRVGSSVPRQKSWHRLLKMEIRARQEKTRRSAQTKAI